MSILGIIIVGIVIYTILSSLLGFYWAIRPPYKIISTVTPDHFGLPFENVSFVTQDKVVIRGWFIPNRNPSAKTIILLHGYPADKGNIISSRYFLHNRYNLLFIDFRYFGQSGGSYSTLGKNEVLDVLAAIDYLKKRHLEEIGIWGLSLGGAVALMTAPNAPEIKAIVSEASYAQLDLMLYEYYPIPLFQYPLAALTRLWGKLFLGYDIHDVSPMKSAASLSIPILIIHSKSDKVIPIKHAFLLKNAIKSNKKAEWLILENNQHGELHFNEAKAVEAFFDKNLM
jgi:dipeptidyl aminopeptidase/acylaminoacyl peptidase